MTSHGGRRTQAERDAITVEIGYALCSAAFAAAVLFGAVAGPALAFELEDGARSTLVGAGATVAAVLFAARVVSVLVRFRRGGQPSQPGRTSPDS
jgi:ABC-type enterobactin transport system permease subunit